jgi:hypothetical protein
MSLATLRAGWVLRSALIALVAISDGALAYTAPTGCTDISQVPVTKNIEFGAGIQAIFAQFSVSPAVGCADCHTTAGGPAGGLNLDPNDSDPFAVPPYASIVNVSSGEVPELAYVVPNRPELSFLFMKINCDNPPHGQRMPLGALELFTPEQQALIYDWIAEGATVEPTNSIFRGTFDYRGFNQ